LFAKEWTGVLQLEFLNFLSQKHTHALSPKIAAELSVINTQEVVIQQNFAK
jgi:hypothetical protein